MVEIKTYMDNDYQRIKTLYTEYQQLKTLCMAALLNDNIEFAQKLTMELLYLAEFDDLFCDKQNKNLGLILQDNSDPDVQFSFGVRLSQFDSYEIIYEKIHVNLYLKFASTNDKHANDILNNYNEDLLA